MNFQQLRILRESVRRDFNLTDVANALYTSQPGVSKHIRDLEDELGIEIFVRHGKRLTGLTAPGRDLLPEVERLLQTASNIKRIAEQYAQQDAGELVIAATHTQARYALPAVIKQFKAAYPRVHLVLHQGSPREIAELVENGEADIGIATESLAEAASLVNFPCYVWHHAVVVPEAHPLARFSGSDGGSDRAPQLTLDALAAYPIVTYHRGFTGRSQIDAAFATLGCKPDVVLSAIDADVLKTYVETGLGVGIIAEMAFDAERDKGLRRILAHHLFPPNVTRIGVRRGAFLRTYACRFIELLAPALDEASVRKAVSGDPALA